MISEERLREFMTPIGKVGGAEIEAVVGRFRVRELCRAVEAEARREALEEAAALATERTKKYIDFSAPWHVAADCAAAIRALAEKEAK